MHEFAQSSCLADQGAGGEAEITSIHGFEQFSCVADQSAGGAANGHPIHERACFSSATGQNVGGTTLRGFADFSSAADQGIGGTTQIPSMHGFADAAPWPEGTSLHGFTGGSCWPEGPPAHGFAEGTPVHGSAEGNPAHCFTEDPFAAHGSAEAWPAGTPLHGFAGGSSWPEGPPAYGFAEAPPWPAAPLPHGFGAGAAWPEGLPNNGFDESSSISAPGAGVSASFHGFAEGSTWPGGPCGFACSADAPGSGAASQSPTKPGVVSRVLDEAPGVLPGVPVPEFRPAVGECPPEAVKVLAGDAAVAGPAASPPCQVLLKELQPGHGSTGPQIGVSTAHRCESPTVSNGNVDAVTAQLLNARRKIGAVEVEFAKMMRELSNYSQTLIEPGPAARTALENSAGGPRALERPAVEPPKAPWDPSARLSAPAPPEDQWGPLLGWLAAVINQRLAAEDGDKAKQGLRALLPGPHLEQTALAPASLCDGRLLCALVMAICPERLSRVNSVALCRVAQFLKICVQLGVPNSDIFTPPDLLPAPPQNPQAVLRCLLAFAAVVHRWPSWLGPRLPGLRGPTLARVGGV